MFPPKVILVPTDFSELSCKALTLAQKLARDSGGKLVVLHVDPPLLAFAEPSHDPTEHAERLRRQLSEIRPANVNIEHRLVEGFAVDAIVRMAQEIQADLIVMGTHGRTGLGRAVLGSVAQQVLHSAPCPVITVNPVSSN